MARSKNASLTKTRLSTPAEPRIRVAALVQREDKVLFVEHAKEGRRYWMLPGGGVQYGETLGEALVREVREETGLDVRPGALVLSHDSIPPDRRRHIVNLVFTAEASGGELHVGEDARVCAAAFLSLDVFDHEELRPDIRDALRGIIGTAAPPSAPYLGNVWRSDAADQGGAP